MEQLKIRLQIADRVYPMTIKADQEEALRRGASKIQSLLKKFEEDYAIQDKQDLLAMCSIQLASRLEALESEDRASLGKEIEEIRSINKLIIESIMD